MVLHICNTDVSVASNHCVTRVFQQEGSRADEDEHWGQGLKFHLTTLLVFLRSFIYSCIQQICLVFLGLVAGLTREREEEEPQPLYPPGSQTQLREGVGAAPNHGSKANLQIERVTVFLVSQYINYRTITKVDFTYVSTVL